MRKLVALALMVALALSLIGSVSAADVDSDGDIIYTDGIDKFIFITDSDYSDTDQFENFKTVMPGDTVEQRIRLRNDISNDRKIKVYMRALGAHEGSDDFLAQLKLTIIKDTDTILFEAAADQAAQLTDWVYVGTLYSGGECELTAILEVPVTLGNEYANSAGYLDWEFGVSEYPVEDSDPKPPQTGDDNQIFLWTALMLGSFAMLMILLFTRKKEAND